MATLTKRQKATAGKVDSTKLYPVDNALALVKECATAKFDESIDVAVQLGIDAKKSDQVVRGAVVLPNGTGKTKRVAVFAQGAKAEEARAAGADVVGMEDLAEQIKGGNLNFDVVIASPDTMRIVGTRCGRRASSTIRSAFLPTSRLPTSAPRPRAAAPFRVPHSSTSSGHGRSPS